MNSLLKEIQMSEADGEYTIADKALEAGKKAASVASSYAKKATNFAADKYEILFLQITK